MSCEDILSLLDLQNTKKHVDDFGRLMGTGEGDSTNEVWVIPSDVALTGHNCETGIEIT